MKTKHEYHKAMWGDILGNPKADAPKLAMADWLEESQVDRYLMIGLRWCVAKRKWPNYTWPTRRYYWGTINRNKGDLPLFMVEGWRKTAKIQASVGIFVPYLFSKSLQHLVRRVGQAAEWVEQNGRK